MSGARRPIQFTAVPVNTNVARSPTPPEVAAVPPLHACDASFWVQPGVKVVEAALSSWRVPSTGGGSAGITSNASTTTA
jgi:hypothetical protein